MPQELLQILSDIDALKARLEAVRPLPAEALQKIQEAWDVEYTYESNRIEGNTLTLQETALVVCEGMTIAGKSMREHLEAINHTEAVAFVKQLASERGGIGEYTIKQIHAIILRGIDRTQAGAYRTVPVRIAGSRHEPPQPYLVEPLMEQFVHTFHDMESRGEHPVSIAAFMHDELVRIHPFIDGNGRTARLLMNLYLLRAGYVLVALKGNPTDKLAYYTALEKSHVNGESEDFRLLVARAEKEALEKYLDIVSTGPTTPSDA